MGKAISVACLFVMSIALFSGSLCQAAIDRGAIQGTLIDAQGASIPKVRVEITNTATGVTTNTSTNDTGFHAVAELVPGIYTVCFQAQGFGSWN